MSEESTSTPETETESASVKLLKPHHHIIHIILTLAFYFFMAGILKEHALVQDEASFTAALMGYFAAVPLGGTFWLGTVMFHVVLADHQNRQKENIA
jgi:hypothetical protein